MKTKAKKTRDTKETLALKLRSQEDSNNYLYKENRELAAQVSELNVELSDERDNGEYLTRDLEAVRARFRETLASLEVSEKRLGRIPRWIRRIFGAV